MSKQSKFQYLIYSLLLALLIGGLIMWGDREQSLCGLRCGTDRVFRQSQRLDECSSHIQHR